MNVITLGCLACRRQTDTLLAISDRGWENEWSKVTAALLLMSTAPVAHSNTTDWCMSGSCWMPQEQSPYSRVDFLESHSILPVTAVHAHAHTHTHAKSRTINSCRCRWTKRQNWKKANSKAAAAAQINWSAHENEKSSLSLNLHFVVTDLESSFTSFRLESPTQHFPAAFTDE